MTTPDERRAQREALRRERVEQRREFIEHSKERMAERAPELVPDPADIPSSGVSNWNIANALTVFRVLLVPVFGWLLLAHDGDDNAYRIWAFVVFVIASITDRIDGDLARSRGLVTDFGKMLDPIADKALMGMALVGLSLIGRLPWWVTAVILIREVGITLLRLSVIRHGVLPASRGGKVKTFLQAIAIGLFVLPLHAVLLWVAWAVMVAALVVTVLSGIDYGFRAWSLRQNSERTRLRRSRKRKANS